jgi:hypothetical protein
MSVTVGDLHLAVTADPITGVEQQLARVDKAAAGAASSTTTASDALQKTANSGRLTARELAETWGVFNRTADAADDLAKGATGADVAVGGLGSTLGQMAANGTLTVAVIAGVSAIAAIYDVFTASTRKAREEQKKLTNALEEWYRVQSLGPGGQRQQQVRAEEVKLADLRKELAKAQAEEQRALTSGTAARTGTTDQLVAAARQRIRQLEIQIQQTVQVIEAGGRDVVRARTEAVVEEIATEIKSLRELEKLGVASVEQRKRLADLERNAAQLRDAYNRGPMAGVTEAQRIAMVLELSEALDVEEKKTKKVKDATDARVAALAELARAHDLTYGDIREAEKLYDAERKVLDDSTASIERRAQALKRMQQLEKSGAVTKLGGAPERQGTVAPEYSGNPFDLGPVEIRGLEKISSALQRAARDAIDDAELGALFSQGMSEAIADIRMDTMMADIATLAEMFANFTRNTFSVAIDAIAAGFEGGWGAFGQVMLGGLGDILMAMGKQLMIVGASLKGLLPALLTPFTSGPAMIAAGALIFGAGAALSSIARGGGGGGGTAPTAGGIGSLGVGAAQTPSVYVFGSGPMPMGALGGRAAEPRNAVTINQTIIGANDPVAQRQIGEMVKQAARRGLTR